MKALTLAVNMGDSKSVPIIQMAKKVKLYLNQYSMMNCVIGINGDNRYKNSNPFSLHPEPRNINRQNWATDEIRLLINYIKGDKKIEVI